MNDHEIRAPKKIPVSVGANVAFWVTTIGVILFYLMVVPPIQKKQQLTASFNNAKQLYLAGAAAAADGFTSGDPALGWPGDLAARASIVSVSDYLERFMRYGYLMPTDLIKIVGAPGVSPWDGEGKIDAASQVAFKVYRVTALDSPKTVFLTTCNFRYGSPLDVAKTPYRDFGFVSVQRDGSGAIFVGREMPPIERVGLLPGRKNAADRSIATNEDTLIQK